MLSYLEYKIITSIPLSGNIYELWKNTGKPAYSSIYNLAKKLEHMKIIKIEESTLNGRKVSRIMPGEAYPEFEAICNSFFRQYYSRATDILKEQLAETAGKNKLTYQIIGGQLDPSRAYADVQIAIPQREEARWKKAVDEIEENLNYSGLTTAPAKKNRFLARKLQIIPLPYRNPDAELKEQLRNKTIRDIHYQQGYAELEPYFFYLQTGAVNG